MNSNPEGILRNSETGLFAITPGQLRSISIGKMKIRDILSGKYNEEDVFCNEKIHISCKERLETIAKYKPTNLIDALKRNTPIDLS